MKITVTLSFDLQLSLWREFVTAMLRTMPMSL